MAVKVGRVSESSEASASLTDSPSAIRSSTDRGGHNHRRGADRLTRRLARGAPPFEFGNAVVFALMTALSVSSLPVS